MRKGLYQLRSSGLLETVNKEVTQGLGLLAVAVLLALIWLVAEARIISGAAFLFAIGGLVLVAKGLLMPSRQN